MKRYNLFYIMAFGFMVFVSNDVALAMHGESDAAVDSPMLPADALPPVYLVDVDAPIASPSQDKQPAPETVAGAENSDSDVEEESSVRSNKRKGNWLVNSYKSKKRRSSSRSRSRTPTPLTQTESSQTDDQLGDGKDASGTRCSFKEHEEKPAPALAPVQEEQGEDGEGDEQEDEQENEGDRAGEGDEAEGDQDEEDAEEETEGKTCVCGTCPACIQLTAATINPSVLEQAAKQGSDAAAAALIVQAVETQPGYKEKLKKYCSGLVDLWCHPCVRYPRHLGEIYGMVQLSGTLTLCQGLALCWIPGSQFLICTAAGGAAVLSLADMGWSLYDLYHYAKAPSIDLAAYDKAREEQPK